MALVAPTTRREGIALRHVEGRPVVIVAELCGSDELAVVDDSTSSAIALVHRLLERSAQLGAHHEGLEGSDLTAADRDRLLAAAHRATFGDRIESSPHCRGCEARYDLDFSLGELVDRIDLDVEITARADGAIPLARAGAVRLPIGRDELAVSGIEESSRAQALLERCLIADEASSVEGGSARVGGTDTMVDDLLAEVEAVLAAAAPTVDQLITASCPECGRVEDLRFDVQTYLLGLLVAGRNGVLADLHRLASAYGWTAAAILELPRGDRTRLATLIEADISGRRGAR